MTEQVATPTTEAATETATADVNAVDQTQVAVDQAQLDTAAEIEYAEFNKPEGMLFEPKIMDEFIASAKEAKLSQDQAQKLVDMGAQLQEKLLAEQRAAWDAQRTTWAESAQSDKEYGGDKFNENLAIAKQAYDALATPELKELLDTTGIGNHPEMIRVFYKAGLLLSEDKVVAADRGAAPSANDPRSLYPNSNLK